MGVKKGAVAAHFPLWQVDAALLERQERLQDEVSQQIRFYLPVLSRHGNVRRAKVSRQQSLDQQKRDFAKAAEDVMAFVRGEKSALDAAAPAIAILPDNTSSITRGKQMLAALEEHMPPPNPSTNLLNVGTFQHPALV